MKTDTTTGALRPLGHTHRKAPFDGPGAWWIDRNEDHAYAVLSTAADGRALLVIRFPPALVADSEPSEELAATAIDRVASTFGIDTADFAQSCHGVDIHLHAKPFKATVRTKQAAA